MFKANGTSKLNCSDSTVPFRDEVWVLPLLALSVLNMAAIICFSFFILCKVCRTGLKTGNMILGQVLLTGLFLASLTGVTFVVTPDWVSCLLTRLGTGFSYAVIYSTLLVKSMFLLSLHNSQVLPAMYQGMLLFFAVLVQLVIDIQWLVQNPPDVTITRYGQKQCKTKLWQMLMSLIYIAFLIVVVSVLAVRIRGFRENYRESKFIGGAVAAGAIIWIVWVTVSVLTESRYFYVALGYGVVCNATVIFCVIFLPKGRQLVAMGHSERSVLNASSYTPSFVPYYPPPSLSSPLVYKGHAKPALKASKRRHQQISTAAWNSDIYRPETERRTYNDYRRSYGERYSHTNPNVRFSRTPVYIEDEWM